MGNLKELMTQFGKVKADEVTLQQLSSLREDLQNVHANEITSIEDAENFLHLLKVFRGALESSNELNGTNYLTFLNSLLSVGEDGIYSDNLRFLFELIQNVDDCDYLDETEKVLEIQFNDREEIGKIILTYNEVGFSPSNVFSITGIAEAAKNISAEKVEIGEKGIGFKSVFGVSEKVLIQSGYFSFELHKDHITIPEPRYDKYEPIIGTKMELFLPSAQVNDIYHQLVREYFNEDALFHKNPLLFLNKLTKLRFYKDSLRSLEFSVDRPKTVIGDRVEITENIDVCVKLTDTKNGKKECIEKSFKGIWFTRPIIYSQSACQSRYGKETTISGKSGKRMYIHVLAPMPEYIQSFADRFSDGRVYSFLPTQIKLTVPVALQVPFKLDASREYVDPQGNNEWFIVSCAAIYELFEIMYIELAQRLKNQVIYYLPQINKSIFDKDALKAKCLFERPEFSSEQFLSKDVFYSESGNLCNAKQIVCIDCKETDDMRKVYQLLPMKKELFIMPGNKNADKYGIEVITDVNRKLFLSVFDTGRFDEVFSYLSAIEPFPIVESDLKQLKGKAIVNEFITVLNKYELFSKLFNDYSIAKIKQETIPEYSLNCDKEEKIEDFLQGDLDVSDMPEQVQNYLKKIKSKCVLVKDTEQIYFIAGNLLAISEARTLEAIADFCNDIDKRSSFPTNLRLSAHSKELDELEHNEKVSEAEYIKKLRSVRMNVKKALGENAYKNYINLILDSGNNPSRFINELLQNADDCEYAEETVPSFELQIDENSDNQINIRYNEVGFTKSNVRAITAIGESTKKRILSLSGDIEQIGEKGVGFKSVFAVAEEVRIYSGNFHFLLKYKIPTIPELIKADKFVNGTKMIFKLKEPLQHNFFTEEKVLRLCLCLRKLKRLKIHQFSVEIKDDEDTRTIIVNGKRYVFLHNEYRFEVTDEKAILDRSRAGRVIDKYQSVSCYVSLEECKKGSKGLVYAGLPTEIETTVPMHIDAPFELTTARDGILRSEWNDVIKREVYHAMTDTFYRFRHELRKDIAKLISFQKDYGSSAPPEMFSFEQLNEYKTWKKELKETQFLPTYDANAFLAPDGMGIRYPKVVRVLLKKGVDMGVEPGRIIAAEDKLLDLFGIHNQEPDDIIELVQPFIPAYITDEAFRNALYKFIMENTDDIDDDLKLELPIVPVLTSYAQETTYITWQDNKIFVQKDEQELAVDYYVLDDKILRKDECEKIFSCNVNEMNDWYRSMHYKNSLKSTLKELYTDQQKYEYILNEFHKGSLDENDAWPEVIDLYHKGNFPLKNNNNEMIYYSRHPLIVKKEGRVIKSYSLYVDTEGSGYFMGNLIDSATVYREDEQLANFLECDALSEVHYKDVRYYSEMLSNDDIESIQDNYFENSWELIQGFLRDGRISQELQDYYGLALYVENEESDAYDFPEEPVTDIDQLKKYMRKLFSEPKKIVKKQEMRTVDKVEYAPGELRSLDSSEIRRQTMKRYSPENNRGQCFCQMCQSLKADRNIVVHNIEAKPKYYWPQMRIALCLECGKKFEMMRDKEEIHNAFLNDLCDAELSPYDEEPIAVEIGNEEIYFTATHLAEIQEILLLQKKLD